ncbi:MAG: multiheme c-type cytochrome [Planctomycetota bacterium]|jgi:hypothetical protein
MKGVAGANDAARSMPLDTTSETGARVNAVSEWRSSLTSVTGAVLLFTTITGLTIWLLPFSRFNQISVILHTLVGLAMIAPVSWYAWRHWRVRRKGKLSHYQLLGYIALVLLAACTVSGLVVTWQGAFGPRMDYAWDIVHLVTGLTAALFVIVHLATVILRKVNNPGSRLALQRARWAFYSRSLAGCAALLVVCALWGWAHVTPQANRAFPADYNWKFGEDRPFAPSLARVEVPGLDVEAQVLDVLADAERDAYRAAADRIRHESLGPFTRVRRCLDEIGVTGDRRSEIESILAHAGEQIRERGAIDASLMARSQSCGTSGCHEEILEEWEPSAHRYSSMDDMFQRVQELMAVETSPEQTRYCAGCHDPISLFSGAKNSGNITLSAEGADEGSSCVVCHTMVQADVQGNGDYTIEVPEPYVYETAEGGVGKFLSDFLIRTYPKHHVASYSRPLYKTAEFCAACHKQYLDVEVNTDIGKVQGQNQYDSWKNSRWYHEGEPDRSISCRECHMPLVASEDPARGDKTDFNRDPDDRQHRSHRMLASNQYVPLLHDLPGAKEHVALTEAWLRGEIEIPEIAERWTEGPVVRLQIVAPERVAPGDNVPIQVVLTNNKTGHDFPTGPLDMIESWIELKVVSDAGDVLYHSGQLDEDGYIDDTQVWFKADGFDRKGELIDRHNLWDLVGASYKRALYPGVTDTVRVEFQCPSMARKRVAAADERVAPGQRVEDFELPLPAAGAAGELTVTAVLWYRKANPEFLDRVYGAESGVRSPVTEMSRAEFTIEVLPDEHAVAQ